jgi:hypothetical protein
MYWYERTYYEYKEKGKLYTFFQEYASDHLKAFQHSGASILPDSVMSRLRRDVGDMKIYEIITAR